MAYVHFDSGYAPCGFLIVPNNGDPYAEDGSTTLIQSDWEYAPVATRMGWTPCLCTGEGMAETDGTVPCHRCGKPVSDMLAEAYDWIREREGEEFDTLDDELPGYYD